VVWGLLQEITLLSQGMVVIDKFEAQVSDLARRCTLSCGSGNEWAWRDVRQSDTDGAQRKTKYRMLKQKGINSY